MNKQATDFLNAVLASEGLYCITTVSRPDSNGKTYARNMPFVDLNTALAYANKCASVSNVYFAPSTFKETPNKFSRLAVNALYQKSFWLDLDCDSKKAEDGKAYATKEDALRALYKFLDDTGIGDPTLVDSGNGYHVYFILSSAIPTEQWKQIARMLRTVCKQKGLIIDHHRTCDAASIMRVPGTYNHKHGALAVEVVAFAPPVSPIDFTQRLIELVGSAPAMIAGPVELDAETRALLEENKDELSFGDAFKFKEQPPRAPDEMIVRCRQIREMSSSSYPAWMLATRTVLHTVNGRAWVHALSALTPEEYDSAECDALCDNLESSNFGPGLCDTFESYEPQKCKDCPFRGKVKTPLMLADFDVPKSITMPKVDIETADLSGGEISLHNATQTGQFIPYKDELYQVIPGSGIFKSFIDADGVPRKSKISNYEIYIHTLCVDYTQATPKRTYIMRKIVPGVAPVDIPFDIADALGTQKIELWTAQCGLLPHPKNKKDFFMFLNTYISAIQNTLPEVYVRNHFGWVQCTDRKTGQTYPGFIVGQTMYDHSGTSQVRLDERSQGVANKLGTKGSLKEWLKVPKLYKTLDQKFAQLLMCTAFGAPLMVFGRGTATNVAFNFWDISGGKGKSSMLKAIASVWGDPQQMLMGRTDTHAARFQQYSVYRNLPILIDELTGINEEETASLLYDIVNGREKARSTAAGTGLAQVGKWDTITVFTANQSMYESLRGYRSQSSATCMRLVESECDFNDYSNNAAVMAMINNAMTAARDNYGIAGATFMTYVTANYDMIKKIVETYAENFATAHAASSDERFWLYGIAIPLIAGRIAKLIGLLDYNMEALEDYCIKVVLPSLRAKVKVNKPTGHNLLMDFLNDMLTSTLIVRAKSRKAYEVALHENKLTERQTIQSQASGGNLDPYVIQLPRDRLLIRREMDSDTIYVSSRALSAWCRANNISLDTMLQGLVKLGHASYGLDTRRFSLGRDVPMYASGTQTVYKFSMENNKE